MRRIVVDGTVRWATENDCSKFNLIIVFFVNSLTNKISMYCRNSFSMFTDFELRSDNIFTRLCLKHIAFVKVKERVRRKGEI
jgi:hypothetical protein